MMTRKELSVVVFERTGFNPCCDKHMDYSPCDCPRYAANLLDENKQIVATVTFQTKSEALSVKSAHVFVQKSEDETCSEA